MQLYMSWYIRSFFGFTFLNILYFFKYSCTNIFHRRSLYTLYQFAKRKGTSLGLNCDSDLNMLACGKGFPIHYVNITVVYISAVISAKWFRINRPIPNTLVYFLFKSISNLHWWSKVNIYYAPYGTKVTWNPMQAFKWIRPHGETIRYNGLHHGLAWQYTVRLAMIAHLK